MFKHDRDPNPGFYPTIVKEQFPQRSQIWYDKGTKFTWSTPQTGNTQLDPFSIQAGLQQPVKFNMQGEDFGLAAVPQVVKEEVKQVQQNVQNLEQNARNHAGQVKADVKENLELQKAMKRLVVEQKNQNRIRDQEAAFFQKEAQRRHQEQEAKIEQHKQEVIRNRARQKEYEAQIQDLKRKAEQAGAQFPQAQNPFLSQKADNPFIKPNAFGEGVGPQRDIRNPKGRPIETQTEIVPRVQTRDSAFQTRIPQSSQSIQTMERRQRTFDTQTDPIPEPQPIFNDREKIVYRDREVPGPIQYVDRDIERIVYKDRDVPGPVQYVEGPVQYVDREVIKYFDRPYEDPEMERQRTQLQINNDELKEQLHSVSRRTEELASELYRAQTDLANEKRMASLYPDEMERKNKDSERYRAQLLEQERKVVQLEFELRKKKGQQIELESRLQTYQHDNTSLTQRLENIEKHFQDTEKELQFHKDESSNLRKQIEDATNKAMMQDSQIFDLESLIQKIQRESNQTIEQQRSTIQQREQDAQMLMTAASKAQDDMMRMQEELEAERKNAEIARKQHADIFEQIKQVQLEKQRREAELDATIHRLSQPADVNMGDEQARILEAQNLREKEVVERQKTELAFWTEQQEKKHREELERERQKMAAANLELENTMRTMKFDLMAAQLKVNEANAAVETQKQLEKERLDVYDKLKMELETNSSEFRIKIAQEEQQRKKLAIDIENEKLSVTELKRKLKDALENQTVSKDELDAFRVKSKQAQEELSKAKLNADRLLLESQKYKTDMEIAQQHAQTLQVQLDVLKAQPVRSQELDQRTSDLERQTIQLNQQIEQGRLDLEAANQLAKKHAEEKDKLEILVRSFDDFALQTPEHNIQTLSNIIQRELTAAGKAIPSSLIENATPSFSAAVRLLQSAPPNRNNHAARGRWKDIIKAGERADKFLISQQADGPSRDLQIAQLETTYRQQLDQERNELNLMKQVLNESGITGQVNTGTLAQQIRQLKTGYEESREVIDRLENQVAQIEASRNTAQQEAERIKSDYQSLQADFERGRTVYLEKETRLEYANKEIMETRDKLSDLKQEQRELEIKRERDMEKNSERTAEEIKRVSDSYQKLIDANLNQQQRQQDELKRNQQLLDQRVQELHIEFLRQTEVEKQQKLKEEELQAKEQEVLSAMQLAREATAKAQEATDQAPLTQTKESNSITAEEFRDMMALVTTNIKQRLIQMNPNLQPATNFVTFTPDDPFGAVGDTQSIRSFVNSDAEQLKPSKKGKKQKNLAAPTAGEQVQAPTGGTQANRMFEPKPFASFYQSTPGLKADGQLNPYHVQGAQQRVIEAIRAQTHSEWESDSQMSDSTRGTFTSFQSQPRKVLFGEFVDPVPIVPQTAKESIASELTKALMEAVVEGQGAAPVHTIVQQIVSNPTKSRKELKQQYTVEGARITQDMKTNRQLLQQVAGPATEFDKKIASIAEKRAKKELRKKFKEDQHYFNKTGQKRRGMALNPVLEQADEEEEEYDMQERARRGAYAV